MALVYSLLILVFTSSCATILNEDLQTVNISSERETLKGTIDGVPFQGPGPVKVKRSKTDKTILVNTEGCQKMVALTSSVDPKFFINILSGGTFGSTTDYSSEKMWKYQDQVIVPCK